MRRITVVVADTEPAGRSACESLLRHEKDILIVAHAGHRDDAVTMAVALQPRILLCTRRLAAATHYSLFENLRQKCPSTLGILWMDSSVEESELITALAKGAVGLVDCDLWHELPHAIRRIDHGEAWVPRRMLALICERVVA
jgi:DNA-binding NarL/FixJ family response regulator